MALRVEGVRPEEIAKRLMLSPGAVYNLLSRVYTKAGIGGAEELASWAEQFGMDRLAAEKPEPTAPKVRRTKTRIRMRRIR